MAFAYGSGVFQQHGHKDMSQNMLDYVFAVDNPVKWHMDNMRQNAGHYSILGKLGAKRIAFIQEHFGARVYFNTLVPCAGRLIKYGVISTSSLINDLLDWETLYISGRLHKPVLLLHSENGNHSLQQALATNLSSAVHVALLLLDETFTEEELFHVITSLSYSGDFRMTVGEDKDKVSNIVRPNIDFFRELYEPVLVAQDHLHWKREEGRFEQSLCSTAQFHHLNLLPKMVQVSLVNYRNSDGRNRDTEEVLHSFAYDTECRTVMKRCISGIVKQSSLTQSVKGIFTAGLTKSLKYSSSKIKKMLKSRGYL